MMKTTLYRVLLAAAGLAWSLGAGTPAVAEEAPDFKATNAPANAVWLDSLDLNKVNQGWGEPRGGKSVDNHPLKLKGVTYPHGLGTHATSEVTVALDGCATRFVAMVGVDDEVGEKGAVSFEIWVDGKRAAETPVLKGGDEPKMISANLAGAKQMTLVVEDGGDGINYDHADWAGAMILLAPDAKAKPKTVALGDNEPPMPIAHGTAPEPRINNPRIVGTTPGRPFLFLIPATGEGPLEFSAKDLPGGLTLDRKTGIITGSLEKEGEYVATLQVKGPKGSDTRKLKIVGGEHKLALTPPMGWNSWNCWGCAVDQEKIKAAADAMIKSSLAAHGFQYINIDDCWEAGRNDKGEIQTNEKFPDMKGLGDYVHGKGLRFGIYSSPGPKTCAGYEASYQHEEQDAKTWAGWGVDYIKYDWCSYGGIAKGDSLDELQKPYFVMRDALDKCDRDIVFSLCQYGMGDVWKWGGKVGGNLWRTTGDIVDTWSSMAGIGFGHNDRSPYVKPGQWNDPDMLVVGKVGWGPSLHPSHLTHNEQITHITLWSLLAAPLLIGCDMSALDEFTVDLLGNDEVLDVDQDPLGKAAVRVAQEGPIEVWARPLSDGTMAVGLFNRGRATSTVTVKWSDLKLDGKQPVRDLWQKKDVGGFEGSYAQEVRAHGAALVKIGKPQD